MQSGATRSLDGQTPTHISLSRPPARLRSFRLALANRRAVGRIALREHRHHDVGVEVLAVGDMRRDAIDDGFGNMIRDGLVVPLVAGADEVLSLDVDKALRVLDRVDIGSLDAAL